MAWVDATIDYLEGSVFPRLAHNWRTEQTVEAESGEQILPHRLPLKRRLAEYRYSARRPTASQLSSSSSSFSAFSQPANLWAIERFRDITPALVVAIFEEGIVLEPGDVGPLPLSHPVTRELVAAINSQRMGAALLEKLREAGAPLYDGCAVIGIVDYRRWAFYHNSSQPSAPADPKLSKTTPLSTVVTRSSSGEEVAEMGGPMTNVAVTPEMHKILLRPDGFTLTQDLLCDLSKSVQSGDGRHDPLEIEAQLLLATSGPVCLDPSPIVSHVLTALHYNADKLNGVPERIFQSVQRHREAAAVARGAGHRHEEILQSVRIKAFLRRHRLHPLNTASTALPMQKFRLLAAAEQFRTQNGQVAAEPMYGLDARKDPARLGLAAPPPLTWLQPGMSLWRTLRFEDRPVQTAVETVANADAPVTSVKALAPSAIRHYTVHIVMQQSNRGIRFEAVLRIGRSPCLGDLHDRHRHPSLRLSFPTRPLLEAHLEQLRRTMQIEGKPCVADVSNPNALAALVRQGAEMGYSSPMMGGRGMPNIFGGPQIVLGRQSSGGGGGGRTNPHTKHNS